jgi:ABC-type oligopeptide transport system ATPase subunit
LIVWGIDNGKKQCLKVICILEKVGLYDDPYNRFPKQLSDDQQQRVEVARLLSLKLN